MKKIVSVIIILLIFSFSACQKKHIHEFSEWKIVKEETCGTEGLKERVCSCGEKETSTIPVNGNHKYESEITKEPTALEEGTKTFTCVICGDTYTEVIEKTKSDWKVGHYVDDFGDETSDAYVVGTFYGQFSNSATTDSDLIALVYLDKDRNGIVQIRLLEYGTHKATALSFEKVTLKIKSESGNTKSYNLSYKNGDFFSEKYDDLEGQIILNNSLTCVITISSEHSSITDIYKFKIDSAGVNELLPLTK